MIENSIGALHTDARHRAAWGRPQGGRATWLAALALVVAAHAPLLRDVRVLLRGDAPLLADAQSHALVMQLLARGGAARGWIDAYNGGFPLGFHYQPLAWLLGAGLVRAGVPAAASLHAIAVASILALAFTALSEMRRAGAHPAAATLATLALCTVSPYNYFVSAWRTSLGAGMVTHALALPLIVLWIGSIVTPRARIRAPLFAMLAALAHAQLAVASFVVLGCVVAASGGAAVRARYLRSMLAAGILGVALYGPGVATLRVPFGWGPMRGWKVVGFLPERLVDWITDGTLLDADRFPATTLATGAAAAVLAVLVARTRHRAARGALAALAVTLGLSVSGTLWGNAGRAGALLLAFVQPLRVVGLVPLAAAACIVVAGTELACSLARAGLPRFPRARHLLPWALPLAFACAVAPSAKRMGTALVGGRRAIDLDNACGVVGLARAPIAAWASGLTRGRLALDMGPPLGQCPAAIGVELASAVPLGASGGAGAHVGVLYVAFGALRPDAPESAARAEALGVRSLLHTRARRPGPPGAWEIVASHGDVELSSRRGGGDFWGAGCITRRWVGENRALEARLLADLEGDAKQLAWTGELIELATNATALREEDVRDDTCDASSATIEEGERGDGRYTARVVTSHAVDVVLRATAFPAWSLRVDGAPAPWRIVAPGFMTVRVAPGTHAIEAEITGLWMYLAGVVASALLAVAAGCVGARRR